MDAIKILLVDGNESFRSNLQDQLTGHYQVRTCQDGKEAQLLLETFQPHILVTELLLREYDGISLLHSAAALPNQPATLVVTIFNSEYIEDKLAELGICGVLMKPAKLNTVVSRIRQIAESIDPFHTPRSSLFLSNLLQELGIPCHLDGCTQLKCAIPLYAKDSSLPLNKVIYAMVAQKCGFTSAKQVERSIRNAITTAWKTNPLEQQRNLFPRGKPTNKVFISRIAAELNQYLLKTGEPAVV